MNATTRIYLIIIHLFLTGALAFSQQDYQLSSFVVSENAIILGQGTQSKGLDINFVYSPDTLNDQEHQFSVELKLKEHVIAKQILNFTYSPNDSIANLIDSLGIDSVGNLDTIVHFFLPYRSIAAVEGNHNLTITIFAKNNKLPLYNQPYIFHQIRIYDLFLNLRSATIIPDSNANPLGLKYSVPDPKWLVNIGVDQQLHSSINRNSFQAESKFFKTTISNHDKVEVCLYNADPTVDEILGCYTIKHGKDSCSKNLKNLNIENKIQNAQIDVQKMERYPASSNFQVSENFIYKNIKGVNIIFDYDLPLHFKNRSIAIKLMNEKNMEINNIMVLLNKRQQIKNRIVGNYSYFISYYNLQNSKQIQLMLSGNDKTIKHHQTPDLEIEKTIDSLKISQNESYVHRCISGILYKLDFYLPYLPKESQLKLNFPTLNAKTKAHLIYWNEGQNQKTFRESNGALPSVQAQKIYVFLPYFIAPESINLNPELTLESIDIPTIVLTSFKTEALTCPAGTNDIQILTPGYKEDQLSGLSGQLFKFKITIPEYYHSKGIIDIQLLENGQSIEKGFFINNNINPLKKQKIYNQKSIEVFLPYRIMKKGATYEVVLQAKNNNFMLSDARRETYNHTSSPFQTISFYLDRITHKEWKEVIYKVGVRNNKNINNTYEHLSYEIVLQDTVKGKYKPDLPTSFKFQTALKDDLIIWIKELNSSDANAIKIKTSIASIMDQGNELTIKNKDGLKQVVFKLVAEQ
ncbi:hypothetical protein OAK19_06465 [Aureispira]|nr:hypothetical protein [Aureispira sp.]